MKVLSKFWGKLGVVLGSALGFVGSACAALPDAITDTTTGAFTVLTDDYNSLLNDYVWPLVILGTTTWIVIDIFRKGANKAVK